MTPSEIANRAREMKTPQDLIGLINAIRLSDGHKGLPDYTLGQLMLYCNPSARVRRYTTFRIPKKSGGVREISAPVPRLKAMLWPVNEILRSIYEPKPCVMGFTQCRSIVDNAKAHLGQNYVLNLDLKDFFPTITQARIWKRLQLPPYSFTKEVANVLAGLCCISMKREDGSSVNVLPQGAPTSPVLTNLICESLDKKLTGVAARFNLRYTRYADDMTFSSMHSALSLNGDAFSEIRRIIEQQGFTVNEKKTRLQKRGARQEVTGLVLSNKVNTPRKYVRDLDQILYVWEKFGYEAAYVRMMVERSKTPSRIKGAVSLENVISGKLDYLKMVKGGSDKVYVKYDTKYQKLVADQKKSTDGTVYLATYRFAQFQNLFGVELKKEVNEKGSTLSFRFAGKLFKVQKTHGVDAVLSSKDADQKQTDSLYISLCRKDDKIYWLAHSTRPHVAEPVELAVPVEKLIDIWEKQGIDAALAAELAARKRRKTVASARGTAVVEPAEQDVVVGDDSLSDLLNDELAEGIEL